MLPARWGFEPYRPFPRSSDRATHFSARSLAVWAPVSFDQNNYLRQLQSKRQRLEAKTAEMSQAIKRAAAPGATEVDKQRAREVGKEAQQMHEEFARARCESATPMPIWSMAGPSSVRPSALSLSGAVYATTSSGGPAASSHLRPEPWQPGSRRWIPRARRLMGRARVLSRATGQTAHLYGETRYAARKWTRKRRVIIKAEVVRHPGRAPKNNPRFVVTTLSDAPETVYRIYCQRGDMENRLKELHHGLEMDRTSCSRFLANQFRVLLTLAAYLLFQELRHRARGTVCADAQVTTLRERLIKLAVWVERTVRRIVLHLPTTFPWLPAWRQIARAVGATS